MNCWRFARIKAGSITSSFQIKLTEQFGDQNSYTGIISNTEPLDMNLDYADICKINNGVQLDKGWAIRGPECDYYHRYTGKMVPPIQFILGFGTYTIPTPFSFQQFDLVLLFEYDLFGCEYEDFSGRLNAYGRKAKKAKDQAPPPDPENPEPCITSAGFTCLGVPPGTTNPEDTITENFIIHHGVSQNLVYAYGTANDQSYTSTGTMALYFDYTDENGQPAVSAMNFNIEVTGTRFIDIQEKYGE